MKCLQCGTELDRLSKWRSSSEFCSEACKKKNVEEFNQLAMNRLMMPRAHRSASVRTLHNGESNLTVVVHPVGAAAPVLTEPPECGFIMDDSATLSTLRALSQPAALAVTPQPMIPEADLRMIDALVALEAFAANRPPALRGMRDLPVPGRAWFALPPTMRPELAVPVCEPVWPDALGLGFRVIGIESLLRGETATPEVPKLAAATPVRVVEELEPAAPEPVAHFAIPSRRPQRPLPLDLRFELGTERLVRVPVPGPPRLRIHLPKPSFHALCPRFGFAPKAGVRPARWTYRPRPLEAVVPPAADVDPDQAHEVLMPAAPPAPALAFAQSAAAGAETQPVDGGPGVVEPPAEPVVEHAAVASESVAAPIAESETVSAPAPVAEPIDTPAPESVPETVTAFVAEPATTTTPDVEPIPAPVAKTEPANPATHDPLPAAKRGFWSRIPGWQKAAALAGVLGVAVGIWAVPALGRRTPQSAPVTIAGAQPLDARSWDIHPASGAEGVTRNRVLTTYKDSAAHADYTVEFLGRIDSRALGWVFRHANSGSYYCLKLERPAKAASPPLQLVKFAVVNGVEQPHRVIPLPQRLLANPNFSVRLDVRGPNFTTQINGETVDIWFDNQLTAGVAGFSNETGERGEISAVKLTF